MTIEETFSPIIHRLKQAVCERAVKSDSKIGPPAAVLTKWSNPPEKLVEKAAPRLKKLIDVAKVQKGTCSLTFLVL